MSLPFLNHRKIASVVIAKRAAGGSDIEPMHEEGEPMPEMLAVAEELLSAIAMKDAKRVAEVLHAAVQISGMMPEEAEELGE